MELEGGIRKNININRFKEVSALTVTLTGVFQAVKQRKLGSRRLRRPLFDPPWRKLKALEKTERVPGKKDPKKHL